MAEFTDFCRVQHPRLVGGLTAWCGDRSVSEEVAQEALAKAYADWRRVSRLAAPDRWVWRVALNQATSRFRRSRVERRVNRQVAARAEVAAGNVDHAEAVSVRAALDTLSDSHRLVLVLRFYLDLPVSEVAAITKRSESAVTSMTHRALERLRSSLDPLGDVEASTGEEGASHAG